MKVSADLNNSLILCCFGYFREKLFMALLSEGELMWGNASFHFQLHLRSLLYSGGGPIALSPVLFNML